MTSAEFLDEFLTKLLVFLVYEHKVSCRQSGAGYHIMAGGREIVLVEWTPSKESEPSVPPVVWAGREKLEGAKYLGLVEAAQTVVQWKIDMENGGLMKINEHMLNWHNENRECKEDKEIRAERVLTDIKKKCFG